LGDNYRTGEVGGSAWRAAVVEGAVDVPLRPTGEKSRYGASIYRTTSPAVACNKPSTRPAYSRPDHDLAAILSNLVGARRVYVNANEGDRSEAGRRQSLWCAQAIP
jgi:hypothetical protein